MKNKKNVISTILFAVAAVCLVIGIVLWVRDHVTDVSTASLDDEISINVSGNDAKTDDASGNAGSDISRDDISGGEVTGNDPEDASGGDISGDDQTAENTATVEHELVPNPYADWYLENSDMVGWLKIPDTIVDYPVMWTPGDENYYLTRNFQKKKAVGGCLILDTDSCMDPLTTNLIIHGHNNPNQMFGDLDKYEDKEYRDEHPYIYLYARDYEHVYEVMAAFRSKVYYKSDTCFKYYYFFQADTEEEFDYFYDNVMAMSYYDSGVTAEFGDHLLTLSTCSYHTENGRFVVVAKEIEPGEYYEPIDVSGN